MRERRKLQPVPVWEHWDSERLMREKQENERSFARGFQMRAYSDSERWFPSFKSCYSHGVSTGDIARRGWPTFAGVDLASEKRPGTVIFVAAVDPSTQRRYPIEVQRGAWTSPETARQMSMVSQRHANLRIIMVENNGYQQSLIDWVKNSPSDSGYWFKIESYTTGQQSKAHPQYGMPSLEVEFKNKAWVVPADEFEGHPPNCRCGWCAWASEVHDYPMSPQTDTVMAMWFCREAITQYGGNFGNRPMGLADLSFR